MDWCIYLGASKVSVMRILCDGLVSWSQC